MMCRLARNADCIGCGECRRDDRRPTCPRCGAELNFSDAVYTRNGMALGCEECVEKEEAQDVWPSAWD